MKMKQLKILGLMVVAAAALMATVGATTASATDTALCEEKTTNVGGLPVCEGGHLYPLNTTINAELETFILIQTPLGNIECSESTLRFWTEDDTEEPLGAVVETLWFKCFEATLTTVNKGTIDIDIIDTPAWTHNGTLTFTGTEIKVAKWGQECTYKIGHGGTLTGGAVATIDFKGTLTKTAGGVFCPGQNVTFTGFYKITSPQPLWVSR
jgi:hypothetical protein